MGYMKRYRDWVERLEDWLSEHPQVFHSVTGLPTDHVYEVRIEAGHIVIDVYNYVFAGTPESVHVSSDSQYFWVPDNELKRFIQTLPANINSKIWPGVYGPVHQVVHRMTWWERFRLRAPRL